MNLLDLALTGMERNTSAERSAPAAKRRAREAPPAAKENADPKGSARPAAGKRRRSSAAFDPAVFARIECNSPKRQAVRVAPASAPGWWKTHVAAATTPTAPPPASGPASATARAGFGDMALLARLASLASDARDATSKIGVMAALGSADIPMRGLRVAVRLRIDDLAIAAALIFEEYERRDGPRVVRQRHAAGMRDGVERLLQLNRWPPAALSAHHAASLDKARANFVYFLIIKTQ